MREAISSVSAALSLRRFRWHPSLLPWGSIGLSRRFLRTDGLEGQDYRTPDPPLAFERDALAVPVPHLPPLCSPVPSVFPLVLGRGWYISATAGIGATSLLLHNGLTPARLSPTVSVCPLPPSRFPSYALDFFLFLLFLVSLA